MQHNKTLLALCGGMVAGFFFLGILYGSFVKHSDDNTDIVVVVCGISIAMLAAGLALYEDQKKKARGGKPCGGKQCTQNNDIASITSSTK